MQKQVNEVYGYSLFNDLEDKALRIRNRAVVLANIAEQYTKKNKVSAKGAHLILSYFDKINSFEKKAVEEAFTEQMKQRGFNVE